MQGQIKRQIRERTSTQPREGGALLERWGKVLPTHESVLTNRDL